jgi:malonate-semialdehyde dehydrogenase (acetylating)/methylmalonate-semialdehyde dehydrogenase
MCGVITNNIVFATLQIVTSPGSKRPVSYYVSILQVVARVPKTTEAEMLQAVASAKEAFPTWSQLSILSRQQVMFRYQDIIRKNMVNTKLC